MKMIYFLLAVLCLSLIFISCSIDKHDSVKSSHNTAGMEMEEASIIERNFPAELLEKGKRLYAKHCSSCHGVEAEGAPEWRQKDLDGKTQPPPLNGSGHSYHHSSRSLQMAIWKGNQKDGGLMPGYSKELLKRDVEILTTWITSLWSDEIYNRWKIKDNNVKVEANDMRIK